jgi:cell division septation protein DedD
MDIRKCISDLLSLHDCVIIPGFGGFIGNYSPARIDPVHHTFSPPSKKLLFNVNLKQNDGLLAQAVAAEAGTSYNDACRMVDEMAATCRHELKSGKSYVIPGVGRLYSGREGNIQFEQEKNANLLPEAFGLASFISPPITRTAYIVRNERHQGIPGQGQEPRRITFPRPLKWAAMLALPVGLAAVIGVTQYDKIKNSTVSDAGILSSVFSRFSTTSLVDKKEAPSNPPVNQVEFEKAPSIFDQAYESVDQDETSATEMMMHPAGSEGDLTMDSPAALQKSVAENVVAFSSADPFAVIVGAFRVKENAGKFIDELKGKGVEASIYDRSRSGLYRVTIGTFEIREEAEQLLSSVKAGDFSGAWLLVK